MSGSWDQPNQDEFSILLGDAGPPQGGNLMDMFANWVAAGYDSGMALNGVV